MEEKLNVLKRTVQDVQNNMEIHDRIFDIEENLTVEEAVKTIKDEKESQITKMSENMSKEENKSMNTFDALENENLSPKSELLEKFTKMVNKIENMESLLERQTECLSQLLSNNINTEKNYSLKVFKGTFLEIESDSQKMYTRGELVNENIAKDFSYLKEEISNIKQNLQICFKNDSESCRRLANVENHLLKLFGENESHFSIYEMIDLVVEMNKSLKQLKEDFASSKSQFQVFRKKQEDVFNKEAQHKQISSSQDKSIELVFEKIESLGLKQVKYKTIFLIQKIKTYFVKISDLQLISKTTMIMDQAIAEIKEKIEIKSIRREKQEEVGFNENKNLGVADTNKMGKNPNMCHTKFNIILSQV